jgi:hypothetical protein
MLLSAATSHVLPGASIRDSGRLLGHNRSPPALELKGVLLNSLPKARAMFGKRCTPCKCTATPASTKRRIRPTTSMGAPGSVLDRSAERP